MKGKKKNMKLIVDFDKLGKMLNLKMIVSYNLKKDGD